jgi:hypothetical protein
VSISDSILLQKPGIWTRYEGNEPASMRVGSSTPVIRLQKDTNAYKDGGWTKGADGLILGSNDYVNDSARLYTPFDDTSASLDNPPLYKSLGGRLLTQSFARGVTGAAFFAVGNLMLEQYKPGEAMRDQTLLAKPVKAAETMLDFFMERPSRFVAHQAYRLSGNSAEQAADLTQELFRFNKYVPKAHKLAEVAQGAALTNADVYGVTWAQEMVQRTWSFASGSIGAALGRNLVSIIDPNHKTSWMDDDGSIDVKDMLTSSAKSLFQIMTYNQMEDWFAAPFYTWQLRAQRSLYDNGLFNRDASNNAGIIETQVMGNSASRHIASHQEDGQLKGTIGESYSGVDMLDYHGRFGLYNTYTLIFRDVYHHLFKNKIDENCTPNQPEAAPKGLFHNATETAKYLVKSLVKSQIYMQPAIVFFAPERIGGSKEKHGFIDDTTGLPLTTAPVYEFNALDPKKPVNQAVNGIQPFNKAILARPADMDAHLRSNGGKPLYVGSTPITMSHAHDSFNHHDDSHSIVDKALNIPSYVTTGLSNVVDAGLTPLSEPYANTYNKVRPNTTQKIDGDTAKNTAKYLAHEHAAAAVSYLPYMAAKYEFANLWDTPVMDAAAYRFTDGLFALNPKEALAGIKDIGRAIAFQPVSPETQHTVNEHRGLVNSRFEGECRSDAAQEKIKHEHQTAQLEKLFASPDNPSSLEPYNSPNTQISEPQHAGQAHALSTRNAEKHSAANAKWAEYATKREQSSEKDAGGITIR